MEKYVLRYLKYVNRIPLQIGYLSNANEIIVLAIIPDNDEDSENDLKMAEAKFNMRLYNEGISIKVLILEESDEIDLKAPFIFLNVNTFDPQYC